MPTRPATDRTPRLHVRGPDDLVHLVPYLLGFRPTESLVVLGLARHTVVVTVRVDLADLVQDTAGRVLAGTIDAMVRGGARRLIGLVFDDRGEVRDTLPWHGVHAALLREGRRAGAPVDDMLFVGAGRWWSYECIDPQCCPAEGTPVDDGASTVPAAAAYAGLVALPDRAALADLLDPQPESDRAALRPALDAALQADLQAVHGAGATRAQRAVKRALFAAARAADVPGGALPDEAGAVRFGAALMRIPLRDAVWIAIDQGRLDGRDLWRRLGRTLPGTFAAPPLFLFGWASWRTGNGALAGIAADRALAADPSYSAADLLLSAVTQGLDPRQVPRLRRSA